MKVNHNVCNSYGEMIVPSFGILQHYLRSETEKRTQTFGQESRWPADISNAELPNEARRFGFQPTSRLDVKKYKYIIHVMIMPDYNL